jgi:hypothetical protein
LKGFKGFKCSESLLNPLISFNLSNPLKQQTTMKHLLILSIALSSANFAFAERGDFRNRTESWLQHENTSGSLRESQGRPELPPGDGPDSPTIPIGGGIACLLALSAGYFGTKRCKRNT